MALMPVPCLLTKKEWGHLVCDMLESLFNPSLFLGMKTSHLCGNESHFCLHGVQLPFFLSRALGQLSNYESAGKIFKRPK